MTCVIGRSLIHYVPPSPSPSPTPTPSLAPLSIQLAVDVCIPEPLGGVGGEAIYIGRYIYYPR